MTATTEQTPAATHAAGGPPKRRIITCANPDCGRKTRHEGHDLCRGCHVRWDNAGRPTDGPPPAMPHAEISRLGVEGRRRKRAERLEDYADLTAWGVGDEEAATRLGVTIDTIRLYAAELKRKATA